MQSVSRQDLIDLLHLHSTSGDEDEVAAFLMNLWNQAGWKTESLGRYAVIAHSPKLLPGRPTLLFCAHMDSPGYIVQSVKDGDGVAVTLGYPHFDETEAIPVLVKQPDGKHEGKLSLLSEKDKTWLLTGDFQIQRGARVCYQPKVDIRQDGCIASPFLDNRVGCQALCEVARNLPEKIDCNVVLAATGGEEFTGFGAAVLARQCPADLVICLDSTYEDEAQEVFMGHGLVLTRTDKSITLGMKAIEAVEKFFSEHGLALQTEVYNYSGTDAVAFPKAGVSTPVLPLLVATQGNHTPEEVGALVDIDEITDFLLALAKDTHATGELIAALCGF